MVKHLFSRTLMENIKNISIGIAGGVMVLLLSDKNNSIIQYLIGFLFVFGLSLGLNYYANSAVERMDKEQEK